MTTNEKLRHRRHKTNRRKLVDETLKIAKELVRIRDLHTCQRCLKVVSGSNCHVSHVVPVSASFLLQFDLLNMKVLCYHDHINWWHKNPIESGDWFKSKFPDRWEYLEKAKLIPKRPVKDYEIEEIRNNLEAKKGPVSTGP